MLDSTHLKNAIKSVADEKNILNVIYDFRLKLTPVVDNKTIDERLVKINAAINLISTLLQGEIEEFNISSYLAVNEVDTSKTENTAPVTKNEDGTVVSVNFKNKK